MSLASRKKGKTSVNIMKTFSFSIITLSFLVLLVCVASASVLSIENGQVTAIGNTASVNIVLDNATAGLSGYSINVSVDNPGVATITSVSYPSWASLTQTSALPSSECRIKASDMSEQVQAGATNTTLATVTLQGLAGGSTAVNLVVNMMNDDSDTSITPTTTAGNFTVDGLMLQKLPGYINYPTDSDGDGLFEDLNGNVLTDFNDLRIYFAQMAWIQENEPISLFDFNNNSRIDYNDLQLFFREM